MSSNLNSHRMIGNLGADPEIKTFENGNKVANIRVATTDRWKDKTSGERKERTEWHNVTIYGGLVDVVEKYCKKGSKVYVEGQPRTRKWQDKDGQDKYSTEVVADRMQMLGSRGGMGGGAAGGESGGRPPRAEKSGGGEKAAAPAKKGGGFDDMDDDIPF